LYIPLHITHPKGHRCCGYLRHLSVGAVDILTIKLGMEEDDWEEAIVIPKMGNISLVDPNAQHERLNGIIWLGR
jgi:hypothetical protein